MSRIHEALKKAEQDRGATQGASIPDIADSPLLVEVPRDSSSMDASDGRVRSLIGDTFGLDVLLRCPPTHWTPDPESILFVNERDDAPGREEFRTLRSRLCSLRDKMSLKSVLITSALPAEGKSFTAANLAHVMALQKGQRALLIDADLRGPQLHSLLGTSAGPGLSDYLQERSDEFSILQRGASENLFFIPSGTAIENPAELVGNGRLKLLLDRLQPLFDWIILDSPPAVSVSDASVLAKACDGVLLIVRSDSTPADIARKARQEFPAEILLGVVLNGTNPDPAGYTRYPNNHNKKKWNRN